MKSDHWRQFYGIAFQMSFYSTLEKCHYQMKDGRFVMEVIGSNFKMLESYRFFCKCVQVYQYQSRQYPVDVLLVQLGTFLCPDGVHTWKRLLEGYSVTLLLHFFMLLLFHQVTGIITFLVCPIVPFFFLLVFLSSWLVSGKVICFLACSSCVCVCVQELCVGFGWLTFLQYLIKVLQCIP